MSGSFFVCGERHLNHLVHEYVSYCNSERSHSCRDHLPPSQIEHPLENNTAEPDTFVCQERLGGLIKVFERMSAA